MYNTIAFNALNSTKHIPPEYIPYWRNYSNILVHVHVFNYVCCFVLTNEKLNLSTEKFIKYIR